MSNRLRMSKIYGTLHRAGADGDDGLPRFSLEHLGSVDEEPEGLEAAPPSAEPATPAPPGPQLPVRVGANIQRVPICLDPRAPLLPFNGDQPRVAEQYRLVRTKITYHPRQPRTIVITSPTAGDGKTVSSINIAGALALRKDVNVLLVEADFRRPQVASSLGLPPSLGLADILANTCTPEQALLRAEQFPNLYILPVGQVGDNPAELLDSARWRAVCAVFRKQFRFTIFDAPPLGAVTDYELIQGVCDGVVMVLRPDGTNRTLSFLALQAVPREKLLGVLLNDVEDWFLRKTQHDYYYTAEPAPLVRSPRRPFERR